MNNKSRLILVVLISLFVSPMLSAQDGGITESRNGIYAEMYLLRHDFNEGFISLNYERLIGQQRVRSLRVGIYPDFQTSVSFPITYTRILAPGKKHHFEYGIGFVLRVERFQGETYTDVPAIMFPVMYRYQDEGGFFFRGGFNLWVSWPTIPSPGISLGYCL